MVTLPIHKLDTRIDDQERCVLCGKVVRNARTYLHTWYGSSALTEEEVENAYAQDTNNAAASDTGFILSARIVSASILS